MERIAKEYKKLCPIYNKQTNIKRDCNKFCVN
jgi:hypothetical protein